MKILKKLTLIVTVLAIIQGCQSGNSNSGIIVSNADELKEAISKATPGTNIIMKNGEWSDVQIKFKGQGSKGNPITLKAEIPGQVIITGQSDLKLGGEYLIVDGLYFKDGASPSNAVIQFFIDSDNLANHSRVTNTVIEDFNKAQRNMQDYWVLFKGRHNQLDHCYLAGKSNRGPTIRLNLAGNQSIKNYHKINNNYFGPRPPKGGPSAETIQMGTSQTSMVPSYTQVYDNLFDHCNGEVEVISSKSNFNEFRNNVFYKSEGSLVTRHGNYCTIDGNYFIGDEKSPHVGGVRLIGTGHWVTNNYFYNLRGEIFRGPLSVMNGIRRPAINRYIQVTDVVVAYNTWVDCKSPWQFGVGSNIDQKDVLPASEIRSETPIRTIVANNIIYNTKGDEMPIVRYDSIDGIKFKNNIIDNQRTSFRSVKGLKEKELEMKEASENIWVPSEDLSGLDIYEGYEFNQITKDLFGNARSTKNSIGSVISSASQKPELLDVSKYGPSWFDPSPEANEPNSHAVTSSEELINAIALAKPGDVIDLQEGEFELSNSLKINKKLTIKSANNSNPSTINYMGDSGSPAFEMNPKAELTLIGVKLTGNKVNYAFASLVNNMSSLYNLEVIDSEISNFHYVLKAYKYSFSEFIQFKNSTIRDCNNGIELAAENDDKGDYNAENLFVINTKFENIKKNVIDYYRGGYDESTVGGNLIVQGCTFEKCGAQEENGILVNTYGIINVDISGNSFTNNRVKLVARLWGAKNNSHSDNVIERSGKLIVEQNLPLKLMY
ncbi:MAG: alginate lyase [bacterium]|nr:alginate lyase [bacterium]